MALQESGIICLLKSEIKKKTRDQALKIISEKGLTLPQKEINKFCKYIGITKKNYLQIIDKFRNKKIWYKEKNKWKIKNFLFKNWNW